MRTEKNVNNLFFLCRSLTIINNQTNEVHYDLAIYVKEVHW